MALQYQTPGVYVIEKDAFGSSIVASPTAVPVFIGFTQKAVTPGGQNLPLMKDSHNITEPYMVGSMLEYTQSFGGPDETGIMQVTEHLGTLSFMTAEIVKGSGTPPPTYTPGFMQPSVANYFANGGGDCYIISLGGYDDFSATEVSKVNIGILLDAIRKADQCTLIVPTDLIRFGDDNYYNWANQFIEYCFESKAQYCVLDVIMAKPKSSALNMDDVNKYRNKVTAANLKYTGAYYPYLKSLTAYAYDEATTQFNGSPLSSYSTDKYSFTGNVEAKDGSNSTTVIQLSYETSDKTKNPSIKLKQGSAINIQPNASGFIITLLSGDNSASDLKNKWEKQASLGYKIDFLSDFKGSDINGLNATGIEVPFNEQNIWRYQQGAGDPAIPLNIQRISGLPAGVSVKVHFTSGAGPFSMTLPDPANNVETLTINFVAGASADALLDQIETHLKETTAPYPTIKAKYQFSINKAWGQVPVTSGNYSLSKWLIPNNAKIQAVKGFLTTNYIHLPASPYITGLYSQIDNEKGVWTPPANVSPTAMTGPVVNLTNKQQEDFNVDATAGKSINAIRSFTGKGTLVWGARTNDGNSNDWRYVNVVRLFIAIETDIRKAMEEFVFKPNVHNTWVEAKTMIDAYLFTLFQAGAFAGTTPATSYDVQIGQGVTMTNDDILNGYMKATIKVAPVRPAEFIVLTFTQMVGQ